MCLFQEKEVVEGLSEEEVESVVEQTGKHPKYFYYRRKYENPSKPSGCSDEIIEECKQYTGYTPLQLYSIGKDTVTPIMQKTKSQIILGLGVVGLMYFGWVAPPGYIGTAVVYGSYLFNSVMISSLPYLMNFNFAGRNMGGWEGVARTCFFINGGINMYLLYQMQKETYVEGLVPRKLFVNQFFNSTMWAVNGFSCFFMALIGSSR